MAFAVHPSSGTPTPVDQKKILVKLSKIKKKKKNIIIIQKKKKILN